MCCNSITQMKKKDLHTHNKQIYISYFVNKEIWITTWTELVHVKLNLMQWLPLLWFLTLNTPIVLKIQSKLFFSSWWHMLIFTENLVQFFATACIPNDSTYRFDREHAFLITVVFILFFHLQKAIICFSEQLIHFNIVICIKMIGMIEQGTAHM